MSIYGLFKDNSFTSIFIQKEMAPMNTLVSQRISEINNKTLGVWDSISLESKSSTSKFSNKEVKEFIKIITRINDQLKKLNPKKSEEILRDIQCIDWKWISIDFNRKVGRLNGEIMCFFLDGSKQEEFRNLLAICKDFFLKLPQ